MIPRSATVVTKLSTNKVPRCSAFRTGRADHDSETLCTMTRASDPPDLGVHFWTASSWIPLVGDLSDGEGCDFAQLRSITKTLVWPDHLFFWSCANLSGFCAQMAALLHTAGYEIDEWP